MRALINAIQAIHVRKLTFAPQPYHAQDIPKSPIAAVRNVKRSSAAFSLPSHVFVMKSKEKCTNGCSAILSDFWSKGKNDSCLVNSHHPNNFRHVVNLPNVWQDNMDLVSHRGPRRMVTVDMSFNSQSISRSSRGRYSVDNWDDSVDVVPLWRSSCRPRLLSADLDSNTPILHRHITDTSSIFHRLPADSIGRYIGQYSIDVFYRRVLSTLRHYLDRHSIDSGSFCLQNPKVTGAVTFGILRYLRFLLTSFLRFCFSYHTLLVFSFVILVYFWRGLILCLCRQNPRSLSCRAIEYRPMHRPILYR